MYDREYVLGWLVSKVIKPLSNEGVKGIISLIKEAYKLSGILGLSSQTNE